ncbi:unnamed protein product [Rotaria sp. Silwood2]|nr:unnamed protein product [Rotaria sp. Silwood2]CAF3114628.1 unnamed protein product [Rotaria sp. Silwood2]CAF4417611.1 unnamed protein product [Rotaria sp. Silwood2]CAF4617986.1 unnamed protein product [Rotaria sp. Silwood2]
MSTVNLTKVGKFYSISLFVEQNIKVTEQMKHRAEQFTWLLVSLASHIIEIPTKTMNLFQDINGIGHYIHSEHSLDFINDMQIIAVEFLPNKDLFLQQFTFSNWF